MIKNIKLSFFFLLLPFLVIPGFFFSTPTSGILSISSSIPIVQNPDDGRIKKHSDVTREEKDDLIYALENTFFGVQKIKFIKDKFIKKDKNCKHHCDFLFFSYEYTYPVDLLAAAVTQLMLEQDRTLVDVDLDKLKGPPRQQLLNLLDVQGRLEHGNNLVYNGWDQIKKSSKQKEYIDFLIPWFLKMKVLGISKVSHPSSKLSFEFSRLSEIPVATLKAVTWKWVLDTYLYSSFNGSSYNFSRNVRYRFIPTFGIEYKTALAFSINKVWTPWLHTLQKAKSFGLTHLTVHEVQVDVSTLVNSKVQEASELSLEQLQTLKKLEPLGLQNPKSLTFSKQEVTIKTWIDFQNKELVTITDNKKQEVTVKTWIDIQIQKILAFQKNWDVGKVSNYLIWLPIFDIVKVKLSQNQVVSVDALATAIEAMLIAEKFDFTKLEGDARKQLLSLLNVQGKLRAEKTFQDDVWRQIKNHQKWKAIESPVGELSLQFLKIQDLGISKVSHPFFPEGYDLSFLKDNEHWKQISFQELLQGMKVVVNGINVEFYSHLFPNQIIFQVPMKKLSTVFSKIAIANIIKTLEKAISDHSQQEKKLETKNQGLVIGLSVAGSVLFLSTLSGFLYWFFKVKKYA